MKSTGPPPKFSVGDMVVAPGIQAAVPVGVVTRAAWRDRNGWLYAVRWAEGPGDPCKEIGQRRNRDDHGTRICWREAHLAPAE